MKQSTAGRRRSTTRDYFIAALASNLRQGANLSCAYLIDRCQVTWNGITCSSRFRVTRLLPSLQRWRNLESDDVQAWWRSPTQPYGDDRFAGLIKRPTRSADAGNAGTCMLGGCRCAAECLL
jgi:hypothetical protein